MTLLVLAVLAGMAALNLIAPVLPLELLITFHLLVGSGRWANVPPWGLGLPILSTTAVLVCWWSGAQGGRERRSRVAAVGWVTLVFVLYLTLTLLWSPSRPYGAEKLFRLVVFCLVPAVVIIRGAAVGRFRAENFFAALRWTTTAIAALSLPGTVLATGSDVRGTALPGTDPITFGMFCAAGVILWMVQFRSARARPFVISGAGVLICMLGLVSSNSKGPIVGLALTIPVAWLITKPRRGPVEGRARVLILVAVASIGAFIVLPSADTSRLNPAQYFRPNAAALTSSVAVRNQFRSEAIAGFLRAPVAGSGIGAFNQTPLRLFGEERPTGGRALTYPHNIFEEIGYEEGALGLLLFSAVIGVFFVCLRRTNFRREAIYLAVLGATIAMVSNDISDHRLMIFAMAIALTAGPRRTATPPESLGVGRRAPLRVPVADGRSA